ncbi:hypothetical protein PGTUg99_031429 [Puccinia graminis f. sp. tritici]|uniref:Uncharacterized protein n=1 Tax=Puccinia graminis f. sp. tritici TaxID=56615 RepID=A0A5B0R943_PUCGR|nr:hypothetical protein PGTUg99_031429 [Puccinia graminis f. sp. tritici]
MILEQLRKAFSNRRHSARFLNNPTSQQSRRLFEFLPVERFIEPQATMREAVRPTDL